MSSVMWRTCLLTCVGSALLVAGVRAQSPGAKVAPTGTLRVVFLGGNPVQGKVDPQTGEVSGTVPDVARELARKLGVPAKIASVPNAAALIGALQGGTADVGFLAYDEARAKEVQFGPAIIAMQNSYLVKSSSAIRTSADIDREGVTVAAVKGQTQEHFVSSTLKRARIRLFDVMPPQAEVDTLLTSGTVDGFAINRQRSLDAEMASSGRLRALPDSFLNVDQCVVVARGNTAALETIERFVDEMRTGGFIKQSIERAKLGGVEVAAPRKR